MLGKIVIELEEDVELDLDNLLPIGQDLSHEFSHQPSLYAYVAMVAARAEACWLEAKRELARTYAATDQEVRRDLTASDERITEGKVEAEVKLRKGYYEALIFELDCREQYLVAKVVAEAMDMRANMLISLGAHLRAEAQQTGMRINDVKETLRAAQASVNRERANIRLARSVEEEAEEEDGDEPDDHHDGELDDPDLKPPF